MFQCSIHKIIGLYAEYTHIDMHMYIYTPQACTYTEIYARLFHLLVTTVQHLSLRSKLPNSRHRAKTQHFKDCLYVMCRARHGMWLHTDQVEREKISDNTGRPDGQGPLPAAWLLLRLYVMSYRRKIEQSCDSMRRALLQHDMKLAQWTSYSPALKKTQTVSTSACNSLLAQQIILLQRSVSHRSVKMLDPSKIIQ